MNTAPSPPSRLSAPLTFTRGDRPWWRHVLGEARTRILLLYIVLMTLVGLVSVPIFLALFVNAVDTRVRDDLEEAMVEFRDTYQTWQATPDQTPEDLKAFLQDFLQAQRLEDDNFLLMLWEGQLYRSAPIALPPVLRTDAELLQRWLTLPEESEGTYATHDPDVGQILYITEPLILDGQVQGTFVVAHTTAGERQEALASVTIFIQVAAGVLILSFVLAWFITGQLLTPVQNLATAARQISETDLTRRIPVQGTGELAELAQTFNEMMNRIQSAFTSQYNFINDASHELRTPITIIRGHLELLEDDPDEQAETLLLVMDELDRMGRLVNDLLLLTKAERPDFLQLEPIDLPRFTEELFTKVQALAPRRWTLIVPPQGQIMGDRQRLTGAVMNLAQNAAQHTQDHDLIELGAAVSGQEVRFWVRDTGDGIPLADQTRIFERFARAANRYRRSDGAGLGLSIVRAIAEAHGGHVDLVSQVGQGSTVTIVFPLERPQETLDR